MSRRLCVNSLIGALTGVLLVTAARAEGSVSFSDDIMPMLEKRPQFERFIVQSFSVLDTGWGVRIDSPLLPHMGGVRTGPYRFQAVWHSAHGDVPVTLVIDTTIEYFDRRHRLITGDDLRDTTSILETLDSIEIDPPDAR
jgi:hypothetical protein